MVAFRSAGSDRPHLVQCKASLLGTVAPVYVPATRAPLGRCRRGATLERPLPRGALEPHALFASVDSPDGDRLGPVVSRQVTGIVRLGAVPAEPAVPSAPLLRATARGSRTQSARGAGPKAPRPPGKTLNGGCGPLSRSSTSCWPKTAYMTMTYGVLYFGTDLEACFGETLARFNISPGPVRPADLLIDGAIVLAGEHRSSLP